ncbi:MAG: HDIG domain-containing protein, partial [Deltaproteobacteria bacterium]|nr:HDIG domain-containing protein [Deltaproteobacteria bacterium]
MSRPFPIRSPATLRATVPWATVLALFLTVVGAVELLVPALHLEEGRPAPVQVRRAPRTVPPPVAATAAARTDLDAYRDEPVDALGHADVLARQADKLERLPGWLAGNFALLLAAFVALAFYLRRFGRGLVRNLRTHVVVLVTIGFWLALFKVYLLFTPFSPYFFPLGMLSMAYGHFLGRRAGITVTMAVAVVGAAYLDFDLAFAAVVVAQGLVIGSLVAARRRMRPSRLFWVGAACGAISAAVYGAAMFAGGRVELDEAWRFVVQANPLVGSLVGGLVSGLLAWWLAMPIGVALGVTSRSRLIDLQDVENEVLRDVPKRAPGTWEHARAMANLAEAAAAHIGADGLLVRVGAYYHDFGKTIHPEYFIENILSEPGKEQPNPHKGLDPKDSADRIKEHVSLGVIALRQKKVPEAIIDFVYMHHGSSVIEFFWGKCQEGGNPHGYTREDFSYPGVPPQSRETAILMIVDAVEAASRTVQPPTREKFKNVVEHIILSKLAQGQLDDSDLSLEDLHKLIDNLVETLVHGRHERVQYPWQKGSVAPPAPGAPAVPAAASDPAPAAASARFAIARLCSHVPGARSRIVRSSSTSTSCRSVSLVRDVIPRA